MLISIWLTNACNLKCSYCYEKEDSFSDMKEDTLLKILDFIAFHIKEKQEKNIAVNFYGGEPLLQYKLIAFFIEKMKLLQEKYIVSVSYLMTTNATLLEEDIVRELAKNDFSISISVDGLPEIHNANRKMRNGQQSFEVLEEKLPFILKELPHAFARMTITSKGVEKLGESVAFLIQLGFKNIKPVPDFFDEGWTEETFHLLKNEIEKSEALVKENPGVTLVLPDSSTLMKKCGACKGGMEQFYIFPNGEVYPCNYVVGEKDYLLGNIEDGHITLKIPPHKKVTYEFALCKGCTYFAYCTGTRCIYFNYRCTGKEEEPSGFLCAYERYLYKRTIGK